MSVTTRNQEVLIAAPRAMVVRAAVAIIVVAGAKTIWGFYLGSRVATVVIFVTLTNRKLQRERKK